MYIKVLFHSPHGLPLSRQLPSLKNVSYFKGTDGYMFVPVSDFRDETLILYRVTFRHLLFQIRVVSTGSAVSCLVTVLFPLDLRSSADRLS
jgi:hypothetical protein